jgi:hypothetical protein
MIGESIRLGEETTAAAVNRINIHHFRSRLLERCNGKTLKNKFFTLQKGRPGSTIVGTGDNKQGDQAEYTQMAYPFKKTPVFRMDHGQPLFKLIFYFLMLTGSPLWKGHPRSGDEG